MTRGMPRVTMEVSHFLLLSLCLTTHAFKTFQLYSLMMKIIAFLPNSDTPILHYRLHLQEETMANGQEGYPDDVMEALDIPPESLGHLHRLNRSGNTAN